MDRADGPPHSYTSYVLHVWHSNGHRSWRATLQATATGQRVSFATSEALFAFLDAQFSSALEYDDARDGAAVPPDAPAE